jgi:hypothetical protein
MGWNIATYYNFKRVVYYLQRSDFMGMDISAMLIIGIETEKFFSKIQKEVETPKQDKHGNAYIESSFKEVINLGTREFESLEDFYDFLDEKDLFISDYEDPTNTIIGKEFLDTGSHRFEKKEWVKVPFVRPELFFEVPELFFEVVDIFKELGIDYAPISLYLIRKISI